MYTRRHRTLHDMLTRYINRESYLKQGLKEQILTCLSEGKCFGGEPYLVAIFMLNYRDGTHIFLPFIQYGRGARWEPADPQTSNEHMVLFAILKRTNPYSLIQQLKKKGAL